MADLGGSVGRLIIEIIAKRIFGAQRTRQSGQSTTVSMRMLQAEKRRAGYRGKLKASMKTY